MLKELESLYLEAKKNAFVPGIDSYVVAGFIIIIDLVISFGLFVSGSSVALSHLTGFFVAIFLLLLFRCIRKDPSAVTIYGDSALQKILSILIYILVQTAIRGGSIASLIHFGLPVQVALVVGILAATLIGRYSSSFLFFRSFGYSNYLGLGITLAACVFALRLVFLGGVEVIPQEAYYWNYAQHLAPGYLDHPPLVAATIYVSEALFGHNVWGSRFGAFVYGLFFIVVFYRYARLQVDQNCAALASVFALLFPYFFLGTGFLISPDAPLSLSWVMALYFFYRVLVNNDLGAWYGVGLAMGIGMLSKYTIVLLVPAALLVMMIVPQARRHLKRKEPYIAIVIALLIFSPVIYWNMSHDWASFVFQSISRFEKMPQMFLDVMLTNILAMVTPLPLLALPYIFNKNAVAEEGGMQPQKLSPFNSRVRLFVGSFLLLPMAVFVWSALEHKPRYNWTGPIWITILPMLAWLVVNADRLRWRNIGLFLNKITVPLLFTLMGGYAIFLHFISIGIPGISYPKSTARLLGWSEVSRNILAIEKQLPADLSKIVVAGLDKYYIASKLAYYGTEEYIGDNDKLRVTGSHLIGGNSLMYSYWDSAYEFKGYTVVLLSHSKSDLNDFRLASLFENLSSTEVLSLTQNKSFGLSKKNIREYYYRIGYDYKPPLY